MSGARDRLVTCDDLGYHPTLNEAIVEILSRGLVRAASLMAAAPHCDDALRRLRAGGLPRGGGHLTLGSEYPALPITPLAPRSQVASLVERDGRFPRDLSTCRDRLVATEVAVELRAQIERDQRADLQITHIKRNMYCNQPDVGGQRPLAATKELARN